MRITRVIIENFGPLRKIDENTNHSVVGLMGLNGSGKSNFQAALEFGLRGKAGGSDEKISSFIRRGDGAKDSPKSANVTLHFVKDGNKGIITRKITRTANTRKLTWMGSEYKKAAEVQALLNDILGVDDNILEHAVFIPQGKLDKLLFGTPTEREDMFIKLMLLGHMSKVSEQADRKSQSLRKSVQDTTILRDELRIQMNDAEDNLAVAENEVNAYPDRSDLITIWDQFTAKTESINRLQKEDKEERAALGRCKEAQQEMLASIDLPGIRTVEAFNGYAEELFARAESSAMDLAYQASAQSKSYLIDQTEKLITKHSAEVDKLTQQMGETLFQDELKDRIEENEEKIKRLASHADAFGSIPDITVRLNEATKKLKEYTVEKKSADAILLESLDRVTSARDSYRSNTERLEFLQRAADRTGVMTECPLCTHNIDPNEFDLYKELRVCGEENTLLKLAYDNEKDSNFKLSEKSSDVNDSIREINYTLQQLKLKLGEAHSCLVPELQRVNLHEAEAAIMAELSQLRKAHDNLHATRIRLDLAQACLIENNKIMAGFTEEEKLAAAEYDEVKMRELSLEQEVLKESVRGARNAHTSMAKIAQSIESHESKIAEFKRTISFRKESLDKVIFPIHITKIVKNCETKDPEELHRFVSAALDAQQKEHNEVLGKVAEARRNADKIVSRINELDTQDENNAAIKKVAENLALVKDAFGRKGIPRSYIEHHYNNLTSLAQSYLESMETNFSIIPNTETPVTLNFIRNDKAGAYEFPQSKLSGGQKVRVTISFLLAIQRTIVPELGLLSLDEPSMHVDAEGIEALGAILNSIGEQMGTAESQVWVSDHNEALATAFGKTIRL